MRSLLLIAILLSGFAASAQILEKFELNPGIRNSDPISFTVFNNKLYFYAIDDEHGRELWEYDDTFPSHMVTDLYPGIVGIASNGQSAFGILGDQMYLCANSPGAGARKLYKYPGSTGIPELIPDPLQINEPNYFLGYKDKLYFYAGGRIIICDPVKNIFRQIYAGPYISINDPMVVYKSKIYFLVWSGSSDSPLGVYDPAKDQLDFVPFSQSKARPYIARDLLVYNDKLYFIGTESRGMSQQLYSYDGVGSPEKLTDLKLDTVVDYYILNSSLCAYNGKLYFNGNDGKSIGELFSYDPATGITAKISDINPGGDAEVHDCIVYKGKLYFSANDGFLKNGPELWVYDEKGPPSMIEVYPGIQGSRVGEKTVYKGSLYFGAYSNTGIELFKYTDTTTVPDTFFAEELIVYPVPCSTEVHAMFTLSAPKQMCIRLVDMAGHVLYNDGLREYKKGRNYVTIPMAHLPAANYILQVQRSTTNTFRAARLTKL